MEESISQLPLDVGIGLWKTDFKQTQSSMQVEGDTKHPGFMEYLWGTVFVWARKKDWSSKIGSREY